MRKPEKYPIQIRLSDADRRRIKSFAAKQGMTIQDAVVEAFNAWAEKLRTQPQRPAKVPQPETCASGNSGPCPHHCRPTGSAVELVSDGENRYWMLRESDAPLSVVLRAIADGVPARKS